MSASRRFTQQLRHNLPVHFVLLLTNWLPDNVVFLRLRGALVRPFLGSCGANLRLGRGITFYQAGNIHIGRDVYIALGCWLNGDERIDIGDEVLIGPYCCLVTSDHVRVNGSFRFGETRKAPIRIKRGAWIAAHVTITAGTTVGEGTLVAASAVTRGEIPDHVMAGGQPAVVIRTFDDTKTDEPGGHSE